MEDKFGNIFELCGIFSYFGRSNTFLATSEFKREKKNKHDPQVGVVELYALNLFPDLNVEGFFCHHLPFQVLGRLDFGLFLIFEAVFIL